MKKYSLLIIGFLIFNAAFSQFSNLGFYNQEGNRFFVIMNGVKMNAEAQTNVKITDLPQPYYKVKIIFEDKTLGEVDKTLNFNPGTETVFQIKKNPKNEWVVRWQSEVPIAQAAPVAPGQTVLVYNPTGMNTTISTPAGNISSTTTTTTTTNGNMPGGNDNINMNMSLPGVNLNMNINAPNTITSGTTTTTTTTSSTTTSTDGNTTTIVAPPTQQVYSMPGYTGPVGCPWPISDQNFSNVKQSIASKSFDDTKLTISKQVIASNCLFSKQVKELMLLFSFEATRLEFAKFAYTYTFDTGNYFMLNDAFQFESSIDELNQYINTVKR